MYLHSKNENKMWKKTVRLTQTGNKIVLNTGTKCTGKYLNSPFYKRTFSWNDLNADLHKYRNMVMFTERLKKLYIKYQEVW